MDSNYTNLCMIPTDRCVAQSKVLLALSIINKCPLNADMITFVKEYARQFREKIRQRSEHAKVSEQEKNLLDLRESCMMHTMHENMDEDYDSDATDIDKPLKQPPERQKDQCNSQSSLVPLTSKTSKAIEIIELVATRGTPVNDKTWSLLIEQLLHIGKSANVKNTRTTVMSLQRMRTNADHVTDVIPQFLRALIQSRANSGKHFFRSCLSTFLSTNASVSTKFAEELVLCLKEVCEQWCATNNFRYVDSMYYVTSLLETTLQRDDRHPSNIDTLEELTGNLRKTFPILSAWLCGILKKVT